MANSFIKAEQVVRAALGILERDVVLPNLMWRDAATNFKGAQNDTISIRLPAYTNARTRALRSGTAITVDDLDETKVDITLDTQVYKAIKITDEELTLDIVNFGEQVLTPAMSSVVRGVEDACAAEMNDATYHYTESMTEEDPYLGLVDARIDLNKANVPASGRFLAVGSDVEAAILKSDRLSKFDQSGSDSALRDASIGRIAGFTAVSIPMLDPDVAIASHSTAFVLSLVTPAIPDSINWGHTESYNGFALRVLQDYDNALIANRLLADTYLGTGTTLDRGTFDADGRFLPTVDGTDDPVLIRAVKLTLSGS